MLRELGRGLVPSKYRANVRSYLESAGIRKDPYTYFSIAFIFVLIVSLVIFFVADIYSYLADMNLVIIALGSFVVFALISLILSVTMMGGIYFYLNLQVYNRTKKIEDKMIDYLVLVSTNLKGGLSFEKSLWAGIKPEFDILAEEMSVVSKKVMTGSDLGEALTEFAYKYPSPLLRRNISIIIGELEVGGEIAKVLDSIIDNLRKSRMIKKELAANTLMFTIFIGAIVLVIGPLLFALAFNLLEVLVNVATILGQSTQGTQASGFGFGDFGEIDIDPRDFQLFSVFALGVISLFSSMIISIIQKGDIKAGVVYIPFFISITTILYYIFMTSLSGVFGFL